MAAIMSPTITPEIEARFWAKVDKTPGQGPNGDCWCWTGPLQDATGGRPGYPKNMSVAGRSSRPSHIAMAVDERPRPSAEMEGLHSCDHRPCVRPSHLRWGTNEENNAEYHERRPRGPRCLPDDTVREIRASTEKGSVIARRLGVTHACICRIRSGISHKHVV